MNNISYEDFTEYVYHHYYVWNDDGATITIEESKDKYGVTLTDNGNVIVTPDSGFFSTAQANYVLYRAHQIKRDIINNAPGYHDVA